jgi:hypothetical protein
MFKTALYFSCAISFISWPATSFAGSVVNQPNGVIEWKTQSAGPNVTTFPDKSWQITTSHTTTVHIPNNDGIDMAMTIAEERAKGQLITWMKENVETDLVTTELQADLKTSQLNATKGGSNQVSEGESDTTEQGIGDSVAQIESDYAKGTLTGVKVIDQEYDQVNRTATVTVGISSKSIAKALEMQQDIDSAQASARATSSASAPTSGTAQSQSDTPAQAGGITGPNSFDRQSNTSDW